MAFPEKYRFYLKKNNLYYTVNASGAVVLVPAKSPLAHSPDGWDKTEIRIRRSHTNMGLLTELTTPYRFVLDGAKILRSINYAQGIDGQCTLVIEELNSLDLLFYPYYSGEVDFRHFPDEGNFVTVRVVEGGVNALMHQNEKTTYEIPLIYAEAVGIFMDGMSLRNRSIIQHYIEGNVNSHQITPSVRTLSSESPIGVSTINREQLQINDIDVQYRDYYFFKSRASGTVNIDYSFSVLVENSGTQSWNPVTQDFTVAVVKRTMAGTNTPTVIYKTNGSGAAPATYLGPHSFSGTVSMNVNENDTLALMLVFGTPGSGNGLAPFSVRWSIQLGQMTVSYNTKAAGTSAVSYRYHQLVSKVIAAMTAGTATVSQPLLQSATPVMDNRPLHTWVSPAEAVRGVVNTKFKIKFSDLFLDASGTWGLAMGINGNNVKLAPLQEFFQNVQIADLGDVSDLVIEPATDQLFSSFKVGSTVGDNDALQGRYAINAPQEWTIAPTKAEGGRDMVSPFIKDMYTIENIRMDMKDQDSTNKSVDNRIVVLEAGTVPTSDLQYPLYRPQNIGSNYAGGLIDNAAKISAYNLALSPTRNILRNRSILSVQFYFNRINKRLKFQSAEREGYMFSNLGSGEMSERTDIYHEVAPGTPYRFDVPPFLPYYAKFKVARPEGFKGALVANPDGYLKFRDTKTNLEYKAFIFELVQKPFEPMECTLAFHPDTDLETLIH